MLKAGIIATLNTRPATGTLAELEVSYSKMSQIVAVGNVFEYQHKPQTNTAESS